MIFDTGCLMLDDILKRLKIQIIEYRVSRIEYQVLPATSHETSDERPVTSNPERGTFFVHINTISLQNIPHPDNI
jgi:hypothetical protein